MKDLFKNPKFVKLFAAGITSQLGNTIGNMALAFYLLDRFSSQPFYATLAELMYSVPTLLVFFWWGFSPTGWTASGFALIAIGSGRV